MSKVVGLRHPPGSKEAKFLSNLALVPRSPEMKIRMFHSYVGPHVAMFTESWALLRKTLGRKMCRYRGRHLGFGSL